MCKIIYDDETEEVKDISWRCAFVAIRTDREGRHIIANDNKLHGR